LLHNQFVGIAAAEQPPGAGEWPQPLGAVMAASATGRNCAAAAVKLTALQPAGLVGRRRAVHVGEAAPSPRRRGIE
jgi:hypothetical protein